jgi:hypothetical protein
VRALVRAADALEKQMRVTKLKRTSVH